jgi:type IV fimbrial biogenesis protein FimT
MKRHVGWRSAGVTLVELLVGLAVMALLLAVAVPSFSAMLQNTQRSTLTNDFLADLALTRTEAIRRGQRVAMCKSADGAACTTADHWDQGWLLFVDANNNGLRESGETLVRQQSALPAGWRLRGNTNVARYVSYHPMGNSRLISGAFQAGTLTICAVSAQQVEASQIVISSVGRPRTQRVTLASCV